MSNELIRIVLKDLMRRKFSSFLTLFAISLGILTIFLIFLVSSGFESSIKQEFEKYGTNRLYVSSIATSLTSGTFTKGLSDSELNLIEGRPFVKEAYPYVLKPLQVQNGQDFKVVNVLGTSLSEDYFNQANLNLEDGRFPKLSEKYSMVIGSLVATDLFDKDIGVGSNIYIKGVKFKVVGILEPIGNPQDDMNTFVNINSLRDILDLGTQVGFVDVVIFPEYDLVLAEENLKRSLENKLGKDSVDVRSPTDVLTQLNSVLDIVKFTLGGIGFVALLVGALGIINTMYVIIAEKKRDIGIMKAIGATNYSILFMFVFQAGLFGFLGGILGIIFSAGMAILFQNLAQSLGYTFLVIEFDYYAAFGLLMFSFAIGAISGFLPARTASKINIIDAIRK